MKGRADMVGEVVAQYRIVERLGGGAMGVVYKAEDTRLRRQVVLKFLPAELTSDEDANRRFMREARAASALDHPNICTVHEIGESPEGELFIVMPFYEGRTLKAVLASGPLEPARAVDYARQIAAGLAHAGSHGVVHRDIKPANLMVADDGRVKIVDFGLALLADGRRLTRSGAAVGTAAYMAPEQIQGADVGPAVDIWALGVVLHEMLTGDLPFAGETEPALLYAILNSDPGSHTANRRSAPDVCRAIVDRCLLKDPGRRYDTAAELRTDLDQASNILTPQPGLRPILPPTRTDALRRLAIPLLALFAVAVLLLTPALRDPVLRTMGLQSAEARGVAVLPFDVEGGDLTQRAFADGLAWLLTERLAQRARYDDRLWVVPSRVVSRRGITDFNDVSRRLGVDLTLKGSLRIGAGGPEGLVTLSLLAYDAERGLPVHEEITDLMSNLETWQIRAPAVAARVLGAEAPADVDAGVLPGCTSVPAAFAACVRGMGWLHQNGARADPQRALAEFSHAVARDSSFARAHTGLGRALWLAEGRRDSLTAETAVAHLRLAAELDTLSAWPLVYLGDILDRWGDSADAVSAYEQALSRVPDHPQALTKLSYLHQSMGNDAAATAAFQRAVNARPRDVSAVMSLGIHHYYQARYDEAAASFRRLVELTPGYHDGYDKLGAVLFEKEDYDEAQRMFERSIALEPGATAYTNLGTLLYYKHRYGDAIDMFHRSLDLVAADYTVWGYLADSLHWASSPGDSSQAAYRKAVELATKSLETYPDDPYLLSDLASYHANLGETDIALALLDRLEGKPDLTAETFFIAADAFERMGRRDQALDWLERACAADLSLAKIEFYPGLRELRTHPRYRDMVARRGG